MVADEGERKLAAILAADVAGYSRLMGDDERATVASLKLARQVFKDRIAAHSGRLIDTAGDSVLAEFKSVVEAVQCAVEVQERLGTDNEPVPEHRKMHFRIGINLGDIIEEDDGTIYGDGVNVAARLEALAEPGGIMVSESAHMQVEGKLDIGLADAGEHEVKNIAKPVRAYRVMAEGEIVQNTRSTLRSSRILVVAVVVVAALTGLLAWQFTKISAPDEVAANETVLSLPTGPSIVVLPFINASGDAEQDYFVDDITGDLITALTRFRELFVIAQNTSFTFKGDETGAVEIGHRLGVRFALEGNVRRSADKIRVGAQFLDVDSGASLWAQTYERDLTTHDIFAIQDEITEQVVGALADPFGGVIHRIDVAKTHRKETTNLDAYECVLRAASYYRIFSPVAHLETRDCLERAVKLDPDYALAWAWLSSFYVDEHLFGFNPRPNSIARALEAAQRGVTLDPDNGLVQWFLARAHVGSGDIDALYAAANRAVALNPNSATVIAAAGLHMAYTGRWERGTALVRKAIRLNPNYQGWYHYPLALDRFLKGEYELALKEAQKVNIPGFYWTQYILASIYGQMGREIEARTATQRLLELYPGFNTETARKEAMKLLMQDELIEQLQEGLRKAGIEDPQPMTN